MRSLFVLLIFGGLAAFQIRADNTNTDTASQESIRLIDGKALTVDLKAISQDKGDFGVDYKLHLDRRIPFGADEPNTFFAGATVNLKSDGFITVTGHENQLNSIISELNFSGAFRPYTQPAGHGDIGELLKKDDRGVIEATKKQDRMFRAPWWIWWDLHIKHETTQDFGDYDFALGTSLAFTTRYLNEPLDLIFKQLRWGESATNNNPRFLDLSIGYDRVMGLEHTADSGLRGGSNDENRILGKVEWETGIFIRQRVGISYQIYQEINPPATVRSAGKDLNQFVQVRLDLLRWNPTKDLNASVSVKYTYGELPPNFTTGHVLGAGFSVDF